MCMTLEITYFHAELVQLIVSQSDAKLEVQRYRMKKNTLTVAPIMLQNELWMRQREKPSPNCGSQFFENRTAEMEFWFLNFEVGSVFRKPIPDIFTGFRTPLVWLCVCACVWKAMTLVVVMAAVIVIIVNSNNDLRLCMLTCGMPCSYDLCTCIYIIQKQVKVVKRHGTATCLSCWCKQGNAWVYVMMVLLYYGTI